MADENAPQQVTEEISAADVEQQSDPGVDVLPSEDAAAVATEEIEPAVPQSSKAVSAEAATIVETPTKSESGGANTVPESPLSDDGDNWETNATPVGLEDANQPDVQVQMASLLKTPPLENSMAAKHLAAARRANSNSATRIPVKDERFPIVKPVTETTHVNPEEPPTFRPALISSAKSREKATSTGYGKIPVPKKKVKEPEVPTFKPDEATIKTTANTREKSAGSQYGKVTAKKKVKPVAQPDFQPKLIDKGISKALREKTITRIYESQKKYVDVGKKARQEAQEKQAQELPRYTLASDRPCTATPLTSWDDGLKPMVFDYKPGCITDPIHLRRATESPAVKHTRHGEKLKARAASHYTNYTPPRGARPQIAESPKWAVTKVAQVPGMHEIPPVKAPAHAAKMHTVTSNYQLGAYKPPKKELVRPATAPSPRTEMVTSIKGDSPLNKAADALPPPVRNSKFNRVSSSGYGVVTPTPSIPAKVESYKHRSPTNQMRTNNFRGGQLGNGATPPSAGANGRESTNSNAENEVPGATATSALIISDLIDKAASMDRTAPPAKALLGDNNGATVAAVGTAEATVGTPPGDSTSEETELTVL